MWVNLNQHVDNCSSLGHISMCRPSQQSQRIEFINIDEVFANIFKHLDERAFSCGVGGHNIRDSKFDLLSYSQVGMRASSHLLILNGCMNILIELYVLTLLEIQEEVWIL